MLSGLLIQACLAPLDTYLSPRIWLLCFEIGYCAVAVGSACHSVTPLPFDGVFVQ